MVHRIWSPGLSAIFDLLVVVQLRGLCSANIRNRRDDRRIGRSDCGGCGNRHVGLACPRGPDQRNLWLRALGKPAAFDMHQSAEFLYHCILLVCTFYTPHVHNLGFLRTQAERIDPRLTYVWPRDTKRDRARFEKLKEAYVKARYSKHYRITKEELEWLGEQVEELGRVVHEICSERLETLRSEVL